MGEALKKDGGQGGNSISRLRNLHAPFHIMKEGSKQTLFWMETIISCHSNFTCKLQ